jgi:hypothetical protein
MTDKTQSEHNESALPLKADVRVDTLDFAFGPEADSCVAIESDRETPFGHISVDVFLRENREEGHVVS